jgi:hypothetical protein
MSKKKTDKTAPPGADQRTGDSPAFLPATLTIKENGNTIFSSPVRAFDFVEVEGEPTSISDLINKPESYRGDFLGSNEEWEDFLYSCFIIKKNTRGLTTEEAKKLEKIEQKRNPKRGRAFRIGMHPLKQFFGDNKQLSLFSSETIDQYSKDTGLKLNSQYKRPDEFGVVLNVSQMKVFEAILKGFSDTNYKGDTEVSKTESLGEVIKTGSSSAMNRINKAYKNIDTIPVLRITQAEIIALSGLSKSFKDKTDVTEAIDFLGSKQFCFYWLRPVVDEKGKYQKDKKGDYQKEEVIEVGTLFRIKEIRDQAGGQLKYYEIHPSAALLDQIDNYFLLIPENWREEVEAITGTKGSKYTYNFLVWLRLQYEQIRRHNSKGGKIKRKRKEYRIQKTWEEIAIALKMPESIYKANRIRAKKTIEAAYSVAIKLGYLLKVEDNGASDILYLNEEKYPQPGALN